jgi:hypothetical protein
MPELPPKSDDDDVGEVLDGIDHIEKLAWWATIFVNVVCGFLALFFGYLQFRNYQFARVIEYAEPEILLKITMCAFYLCWVFGPKFDIKVQKLVYVKDPHRGELALMGFFLLITFSITATFMLWAIDNEKAFFISLTAFMGLNIVSYFYIFHRMHPAADASGHLFFEKQNYFRFLQLMAVTEYMFGTWQRYRFLFIAVGVCILDAIFFSDSLKSQISEVIHQIIPDVKVQTVTPLLPDFALLLFLVISEGWIWTRRLSVKISLSTIEEINKQFRLQLR